MRKCQETRNKAGKEAFVPGQNAIDHCPYTHNTIYALEWTEGWVEAAIIYNNKEETK